MRYFQISRTFLRIGCLRWLSKSTYFFYFLYFLRFLHYWRNIDSLLLIYYMRLLTGRPSFHLLSLSLLLFLGISSLSLYLRLFFLLLYFNINIISSALTSNIMATGQELIRVNGGQAITSVNNAIRYLNTIPKVLRFTH
jgi:hypothetical protein